MRYSFSAEFLKVLPPATNFGEAWENLCLSLLRAETSDKTIMRLGPPDRGIDIFRQASRDAYQCKSSERGMFGTIDAQDCISSFARAIDAKTEIPWSNYSIALNAPLSGVGFSRLTEFAKLHSVPPASILPAEYWDSLCERHVNTVKELFDYRVFVSEAEVLEAFRKAQYYDTFIEAAARQLESTPLTVAVSNNRTPIELTLPFSGDLTIGELLDVVKSILGITLDWENFEELGTSSGPSLSVTIDRKSQPFTRKLSELTPQQRLKLQLWIQLRWRSQTKDDDRSLKLEYLQKWKSPVLGKRVADQTIALMQSMIQKQIWHSLRARSMP